MAFNTDMVSTELQRLGPNISTAQSSPSPRSKCSHPHLGSVMTWCCYIVVPFGHHKPSKHAEI